MRSFIARGGIAVALFLALGSSSCSTRPNLVIHQSDAISIVLREMPAGYPAFERYPHSSEIPPHVTSDILESLTYEVSSGLPFLRGQRRQVFTSSQAESLAPQLSKALSQALPQEVVAFTVADQKRPFRQTKGLMFVLGEELHLIIEELHKPSYQGEQNTYQQQVPKWELIPGNKQRHYASRLEGKGRIANWIITPLR